MISSLVNGPPPSFIATMADDKHKTEERTTPDSLEKERSSGDARTDIEGSIASPGPNQERHKESQKAAKPVPTLLRYYSEKRNNAAALVKVTRRGDRHDFA